MSLGSIYAPESADKGRDLRWQVKVSAKAVGGAGVPVELPERLPVKDAPERAQRTIHPQDPQGAIVLHLPERFASGSALRLRGYGEAKSGAASGDLFLVVTLVEQSSTALVHQVTALAKPGAPSLVWGIVAALLALLSVLWVF